MKNKNALIIIAKYPEQKYVKTRLTGAVSDKKRLSLYKFFLDSALKRLGRIKGADTFIAFAPRNKEDYFLRYGLPLLPLPAGDLGARMYYAFKEVFKKGYKKAALSGVDIPDLSARIVLKAFDLLTRSDIVFGPAKDGGYYLVGMKTLIKEIFEGVPWSSDKTLMKSIENAKLYGYNVALTEMLADIDTAEDLKNAGFLP